MSWPETGIALLTELQAHPGRLALASGAPGLDEALEALAGLLESSVTRVGTWYVSGGRPRSPGEIQTRLGDATILTDLEILFWKPLFDLDVLRLLTQLARHRPIVAAWPGQIGEGRAAYSLPGRRDYFEGALADVVVLRPQPRLFPDQAPFQMEHIPA